MTQRRAAPRASLDLAELSLELARLDLARTDKLCDRVVGILARFFKTDRVSIIHYNERTEEIERACFTGFEVPIKHWKSQAKLIHEVSQTRQPILMSNVREHPEILTDRAEAYKTDAFAIYPLTFDHKLEGIVCLSNLSTQQVLALESLAPIVEIVLAQLAQLVRFMRHSGKLQRSAAAETAAVDEVELLHRLLEQLEQTRELSDVIAGFTQLVAELLPLELVAVIHDRVRLSNVGIISLRKPLHASEVRRAFGSIAEQWQRRHKRAAGVSFEEAKVLGGELICEEAVCAPEHKLGATEVFPIFLDNDLFALVCIAAPEDALADRRRLQAFNVMAHQLFNVVKKRLLLAENTEMQTHDSLTGLINERQFYHLLEREFDRASRYNTSLSLLFVDIDHFKDINESYGFETGDQVLLDLARIVSENMRNTDFASRYSGERFVVVAPETPYGNAETMGNRLRRYIENHSFFIPNTSVFIKVTASIGVASYLDHKPASVAQFIEYADTALYFAKRNGRNQVVGYSYVINLMCSDTKHEG